MATGAYDLGATGFTYDEIVRLLFDPLVTLPPAAIIYTSDIEEAEASGATSVRVVFESIACDKRRKGRITKGFHRREIDIPLSVARLMAFPDYETYLAAREAALADKQAAP